MQIDFYVSLGITLLVMIGALIYFVPQFISLFHPIEMLNLKSKVSEVPVPEPKPPSPPVIPKSISPNQPPSLQKRPSFRLEDNSVELNKTRSSSIPPRPAAFLSRSSSPNLNRNPPLSIPKPTLVEPKSVQPNPRKSHHRRHLSVQLSPADPLSVPIELKKQKTPISSQTPTKDSNSLRKSQSLRSYRAAPLVVTEERSNIISEIVKTEGTYYLSLIQLVDNFKKPLLEKKIIDQKTCQILFSNIDDLLYFSQIFYSDLKKRELSSQQIFSDIFLTNSRFFTLYKTFVDNFDLGYKKLLNLMDQNSSFSHFIKESSNQETNQKGLAYLNSLMIQPIQRLPRYLLMIDRLINVTFPDHPDYSGLCAVYELMKELANFLNEKRKKSVPLQYPPRLIKKRESL